MGKDSDQFTDQEAQRRFVAALRAAVNTPPKPLKDVPKKRDKTQPRRVPTKKG